MTLLKTELTQEQLKEVLHYDPESGVFIWLTRSRNRFMTTGQFKTWNKKNAGNIAGWRTKPNKKCKTAYIQISVFGGNYLAHRLTCLWMTGEMPEQVDHRNRNGLDNRWVNLYPTNQFENMKNQGLYENNSSGFNGVYQRKDTGTWRVQINVNGKRKYLGNFTDLKAAIAVRKAANIEYGFSPNHGKKVA